ncbi:hypothetical protein [Polaromonas aquatica]|uniref:hypothetical protein n=1 Tax=Polaromonas aquatica TaxID=332657 RepID=UPI003D659859
MTDILEIVIRWFGAAILAVFAYVPLFICYGMLETIFREPSKFDWFFVVAFGISSVLAYFLCLLTYRALTGRGRKSDGRLLPPAVLAVFFALFALVGLGGIGFGIWQGKIEAVFGGIAYVALVLPGLWHWWKGVRQK